jgi:hypothetical protein
VQDGFAVLIVNGFLVVENIPFVDDAAQVRVGLLPLPTGPGRYHDCRPEHSHHVLRRPCARNKNGKAIDGQVHGGVEKWSAAADLTTVCGFSQKEPEGNCTDFYEQVTSRPLPHASHQEENPMHMTAVVSDNVRFVGY